MHLVFIPSAPALDDTLMIEPPPSLMNGRNALQSTKGAVRLTARTSSHSSSLIAPIGVL